MRAGARSFLTSLGLLGVCFRGLLLFRFGLWLFWYWPLDFMGEVDPLWSNPFVETFVELLIMHVESRPAFASCDGKNFCFSVFAILLMIVSWAEGEICRIRCAKPTFSIMALTPILQHMLAFIQRKYL